MEAALIAALIRQIPVAVQGIMGIITAIQEHGANLTDEEAKAKLDELNMQIGAAAISAKELAARIAA